MPLTPAHRSVVIPADPATVWEVISTPGHLEECHPFCAANPVDRWPGPNSVDHIEYYSGRRLTRRFVAWHPGSGYDIEIADSGGRVADVTWRLTPDPGGTRLAITITPRMLDGWPLVARRAYNRLMVRPMLSRYLRSVVAGVSARVTTGTPVRRNQFGAHMWFSPSVR